MSKSRLEKFLYALYSLDSSDLPTPLSRIEELYKCWVTGADVPTFEPLSRVEKYLMAVLGVYDVELLPDPLSRVEVLLHKLATGDDNLDDIKSFLSEHEELLAEIIRNGGVGENIDFEYVLYTLSTEFNTLYNTAEKPVKSAILKGNSEVVVGKNKCNMEKIELGWIDGNTGVVTDNNEGVFLPVEVSGTITISNYIHSRNRYVYEYDVDGNYLGRNLVSTDNVTLVLNKNTTLIKIGFYRGSLSTVKSLKLQVEQGEIATEYESYNQTLVSVKMPVLTTSNEDGTKTNILTVNEDIELRGIGNIRDELDLMTGELTQRVREFVLDGSEKWDIKSSEDRVNTSLYRADNIIANDLAKVTWGVDHGVSLPIPYRWNTYDNDEEGVVFTQPSGHCYIRSTIRNLSDFTQWLMANPITIQYELATESIKTVDLSTVNQDGNNTKLSTFNDITYVTLSSEGLIPEAELEVATKNKEVLNTMSLEMNDISTTQNALQETSNAQSENVDATMIATTEIYEGLL